MRILCLHGRGSNNEIFKLQTAAIRADLDDMEFEFVQGTVLHTEGNWSLYTTAASDLPLYGYYNPLSAQSVLETEESLLELIEKEGPFDGVLGYSAGASLAGQIICSDAEKYPFKSPDERPFRFACFINAISPLKAFRLEDEQVQDGIIEVDSVTNPVVKAALDEYLRPSATRARKSFHKRADMPDSDAIRQEVESLQTRLLEDGTPFFTDGEYGMARYDANFHGTLIAIPTLHVRCPESGDAHDNGAHTQALCESDLAKEIHHPFGHDFPRGAQLLKKISAAFRGLADSANRNIGRVTTAVKRLPIAGILAMLKYLFSIAVVSLYYATQIFDTTQYQQTFTDATHWNLRFGSNEGLKSSPLAETQNWSWTLETNEFVPNQYQRTPYVSNGYIGQRLPAEGVGYWIDLDGDGEYVRNSWPLDQPRATFGTIAGFWNLQARMKHVLLPDNLKRGGESVISGIPDWTGLILTTSDGHAYAPGVDRDTVVGFYQSLSIRHGLVHTNVTWSPTEGHRYQLNFTVLAHRSRPNVGIVRLDFSANRDVNCSVIDVLDGAGAVRARFNDKGFEAADNVIWTSVKPIGIDYKTAHVYSTVAYESSDTELMDNIDQTRKDATRSPWVSQNSSTIAQSWNIFLNGEQSVTLYKYVGIASDDAFPHAAHETAMKSAMEAKATGWRSLLEEHELAWDKMWKSADIITPGDNELQTGVRASLFHILSSLRSEDEAGNGISDNSITVGGLSSDSYAGLVFWDADTWVYPSALALHPGYASTINNYRTRLLPQAIENAKFYNYSGSLYPWTSGRFGNCTGTGVCKDYQYHLNTDIALAHWQYFQSTRDVSWLREKGWPIIKNVADMFAAYVVLNETTKEYETILLGEPDEFAYFKNNGAYTNAGIKRLLGNIGPAAASAINQAIPHNWSKIAENIRIPIDHNNNITLGFDGMKGDWKVKQASVALMNYPLEYQISEEHTRNDMAYYSSVNTADGPAMTWSIFAISEAQLQASGCAAYTYLMRSGKPYFRPPFYQFSETAVDNYENSDDFNPAFPFGLYPAFPFLTGAGGYLQVFTHGLTGMRPHLNYLIFDPTLPPQIPGGITIKGIKWQRASFDISINLEYTTITRQQLSVPADNAPAAIRIGVQNPFHGEYKLLSGETLTIPTRRPDKNNTTSNGIINIALCKPVATNTTFPETHEQRWVFGRYPASVVDGSNATVWQPLSPRQASVTINLEDKVNVSEIIVNWGSTPAHHFTIHGHKDDENKKTTSLLYDTDHVEISAPFNASDIYEVKIREANTTVVQLPEVFEATAISLTIEGTQGEEQRLGATVAELIIL